MSAEYVLGIDLGTTNNVLAFALLEADAPRIELMPIPQLVAEGTVESRDALPSFVYLGAEHDAGTLDLPWAQGRRFAAGDLARRRSAEVPDRTVSAAKSWLCHSRVDRHQPILPWNAPEPIEKISPVAASRYYLEHLVAAWESAHPDAPVREQQVVLTVPASFDAAARELTREAALAAGLPEDVVLIEEPRAAVYCWLDEMGDRWRSMLSPGDTLLVCDVGGGTTDLTLVTAIEQDGELTLERLAVGNHLLVGGDNMDLALAHHVAGLFAEEGTRLDPWQSVALWHACRTAKETLLAGDGPESHPVSVLGRGSKLIGGTVTVEVPRDATRQLLVDGFFPRCALAERPVRQHASGFQEIGLPFESDTAVTRHLAAFLAAHGNDDGGPVRPTHVLFNGGVFKAGSLRSRLLEVFSDWFGPDDAPKTLEAGEDLDNAVARGAAHYGWVKQNGGVRIRGGIARTYYVGIETAGPAIPGASRPMQALCVAPFGMEEGTEVDVPSDPIGLVVGEPAQFRFFSSSMRKDDAPGDVLSSWNEDELAETDPLELTLPADEAADGPYVPVRFRTDVTELGVLRQWCVSTQTEGRWKMEFSVRDQPEA